MKKREAYSLGYREDQFIEKLRINGFNYDKDLKQVEFKGNSRWWGLGNLIKNNLENHPVYCLAYLIIYTDFEKAKENNPEIKNAFSKLRKIAEDF